MHTAAREELQDLYSRKSQEEFLRLAADSTALSQDARKAISDELLKRGLSDSDVRPYREALELEKAAKAQKHEALAKRFQLPKILQWVWPNILDEASARIAAKGGFGACMFIAGASFLVGILSLLGVRIGNFDAWIMVDATLFAFIGWRIYRLSRTWAVVGLILFLAELWYKVASGDRKGLGVVTVILLLGLISGVRGTFAFHRFRRERQPSTETV